MIIATRLDAKSFYVASMNINFGIDTGVGCSSGLNAFFSIIIDITIVASAAFCSYKLVDKYLASRFSDHLPTAIGKVSIESQIFFAFVPILNFWAFYRINKLRRYLGYIILPVLASYYIFGILPGVIVFIAISIYLVVTWSRRYNKQFTA